MSWLAPAPAAHWGDGAQLPFGSLARHCNRFVTAHAIEQIAYRRWRIRRALVTEAASIRKDAHITALVIQKIDECSFR